MSFSVKVQLGLDIALFFRSILSYFYIQNIPIPDNVIFGFLFDSLSLTRLQVDEFLSL